MLDFIGFREQIGSWIRNQRKKIYKHALKCESVGPSNIVKTSDALIIGEFADARLELWAPNTDAYFLNFQVRGEKWWGWCAVNMQNGVIGSCCWPRLCSFTISNYFLQIFEICLKMLMRWSVVEIGLCAVIQGGVIGCLRAFLRFQTFWKFFVIFWEHWCVFSWIGCG